MARIGQQGEGAGENAKQRFSGHVDQVQRYSDRKGAAVIIGRRRVMVRLAVMAMMVVSVVVYQTATVGQTLAKTYPKVTRTGQDRVVSS